MRVEDAQEAIVVDEELSSLQGLAHVLPTVQHLNVAFNSLTSLAGLEQAFELRNLNIAHNAIASIQEVAHLTSLRVLKCSHNEIADLSWVSGLTALQELWVHCNRIESPQIAHLAPLSQLQTLVLHPNPCTELSSYVTDVVRALPWLERLDTVVVDQVLRDEAQHGAERETLSTSSTDYSVSLLSDRSDDSKPSTPLLSPLKPVPPVQIAPPKKKTKQDIEVHSQKARGFPDNDDDTQEIAEEFMRNFPVQDYIPVEGLEQLSSNQDLESSERESMPQRELWHELEGTHKAHEAPELSPPPLEPEPGSSTASLLAPAQQQLEQEAVDHPSSNPPPSISSIASAVLSLPTFTSDGFLSKTNPSVPLKLRTQLNKKKTSVKAAQSLADDTTMATNFKQEEWLLTYPNTTVTAIQIRSDGSAIAKWPNGAIAVSVDRDGQGFRIYAAHKDGQIALSFDSMGVGFINYHPSGKMLISTTSSGDGLYFSSDGGSVILRQWDKDLNLKDENFELTEALGGEDDGSLLLKLSDGIGVRVRLVGCAGRLGNPIQLGVYFATTCGIRHKFTNSVNIVGENGGGGASEACDCVFGKQVSKNKRNESNKPPPVPHADLLQDIRAAVASLQL